MSAPGTTASAGTGQGGRTGRVVHLLLAVVCGGYAMGAALDWGSPEVALIMGDFGLSAAAATAAVSCLLYARTRHSRPRAAWYLFALSSAMAALGNGVWGWYEVVLRVPVPSPSFADLFFLCFAPPAIVGLLLLAKRPVTRAGWICLGLDTWLICGSLLTLSWSLALAHTARFQGRSVSHTALSLAYPLLDIALVSIVLALHYRRTCVNRSTVNTAIGALALTVMCDALFSSPLLHASYRSGQLLDAGWFAGSLLLAYAPWASVPEPSVRPPTDCEPGAHPQQPAHAHPLSRPGCPADPGATRGLPAPQAPGPPPDEGRRPERPRPTSGSLAALAPYLAATVCTLGILYNVLNDRSVDRVVLVTACTVVLALVVRQGIMLMDNVALTRELAEQENHFRSLVQGSSDVIMIAAPNGVLQYVSPAAAGVYGRDADDLVGSELASLIHPDDRGAFLHEVRRFLAADPPVDPTTRIECRFHSGNDQWLHVESTVNRHHGGLLFNSRDVTERVRLQAQLQHSAEHDPLTGLPNRALFTRRVAGALGGRRSADRDPGTAVLFIDLDGFKAVNDTHGHQAGDALLVEAARRLQEAVRQGDTAARLGGDEFAALVVGGGDADRSARERHLVELADRLRIRLSQPYAIGGHDLKVAASIGIAFAEPGLGESELLRNADLAMYRAKAAGKGRVELYAPHLQAEAVRRTELAGRLRTALDGGEFALLHQPVVHLATGSISAVAAQARWRSGQGVLFTPAEFRTLSELPGHPGGEDPGVDRAAALDRWTLEEAVARAAERARAGHRTALVVRLGAHGLLERGGTAVAVEGLLTRHGLAAGQLTIELADVGPALSLDALERRLTALRRAGARIALDGFGAGPTAIEALRRLPLDVLKLDRGLVEGVVESIRLHKITSGLVRIATALGLEAVADGVDLPEQVTALRAMGCTHGQGMAFSGALDEHRLRRALTTGRYPVPREQGGEPREPVYEEGPKALGAAVLAGPRGLSRGAREPRAALGPATPRDPRGQGGYTPLSPVTHPAPPAGGYRFGASPRPHNETRVPPA
ncbi:putative bifunctional diguanylate cyclase/phosphodiesterase [Streptomyces sp. LE64]|uniref:putative bifunctional diguanylate cyclase/phosphodiesterase n=1 Tax=Streptomyces sp. LE64 TaxID=3448653 RepID=UPI00404252FA